MIPNQEFLKSSREVLGTVDHKDEKEGVDDLILRNRMRTSQVEK